MGFADGQTGEGWEVAEMQGRSSVPRDDGPVLYVLARGHRGRGEGGCRADDSSIVSKTPGGRGQPRYQKTMRYGPQHGTARCDTVRSGTVRHGTQEGQGM